MSIPRRNLHKKVKLPKRKRKVVRNKDVAKMWNDGYRAVRIAKEHNISRARVYQILDNYFK